MYYRRKILLSVLEIFGGSLEKIELQKLLLIFSKMQKKQVYHFIPYSFGAYSFQLNADTKTLEKYNLLNLSEKRVSLGTEVSYTNTLKNDDLKILNYIGLKFKNHSSSELIKYTYKKFPYYSINSTIKDKYMNKSEIDSLKYFVTTNTKKTLFTIGYEGISLEEYLNILIKNNISVLCDVRKNSISMKFGFSKHILKTACNGVGIDYLHIPDLGIDSSMRRSLNSQSDYDSLFNEYNKVILDQNSIGVRQIDDLFIKYETVALTCFEADIHKCHRSHLALKVINETKHELELKHI